MDCKLELAVDISASTARRLAISFPNLMPKVRGGGFGELPIALGSELDCAPVGRKGGMDCVGKFGSRMQF